MSLEKFKLRLQKVICGREERLSVITRQALRAQEAVKRPSQAIRSSKNLYAWSHLEADDKIGHMTHWTYLKVMYSWVSIISIGSIKGIG